MSTIRKTHQVLILAALAAALSGSVYAAPADKTKLQQISITGAAQHGARWVFEGDGLVANVPFRSLMTRAEVRSEMFASRARGDWVFVGDGLQARSTFKSLKTRGQVTKEMFASRARGDWVYVGDGLQPRSRSASTLTAGAGGTPHAAE